jgi:hypothetical protein
MIEWKGTRKDGKVAVGKLMVGATEVEWVITKSAGGLSYSLHLGEVKTVPMVTRSTIIECKLYAQEYF